jgi:hypothetical protein
MTLPFQDLSDYPQATLRGLMGIGPDGDTHLNINYWHSVLHISRTNSFSIARTFLSNFLSFERASAKAFLRILTAPLVPIPRRWPASTWVNPE